MDWMGWMHRIGLYMMCLILKNKIGLGGLVSSARVVLIWAVWTGSDKME